MAGNYWADIRFRKSKSHETAVNHNFNEDKNRGGKGWKRGQSSEKEEELYIEMFGRQIRVHGHFLTRTFFSLLDIFQIYLFIV